MEVIGNGKVDVYPIDVAYPHEPDPEENWQESFVIHFWDLQSSVGAFLRIGHEPNFDGGRMAVACSLVTPDGIFHRTDHLPIRPGDVQKDGVSCDNEAFCYRFDGKNIHWRINAPGVSAKLMIEDFHATIDGYPKSGAVSKYAPKHIEVSCRVFGTVTTQGNTYQVDGIGIRDHGWGLRTWNSMVSFRWSVGVFDRDNSFCALAIHTTDDFMAKFGWVIRGDKIIYADKVDIVSFYEIDGASTRGGILRLSLPTGEIFEARFDAMTPCTTNWIHDTLVMDNFCRVTWGDKVGVGDFETSTNLLRGAHRPLKFVDGTVDANGWHPAGTGYRVGSRFAAKIRG